MLDYSLKGFSFEKPTEVQFLEDMWKIGNKIKSRMVLIHDWPPMLKTPDWLVGKVSVAACYSCSFSPQYLSTLFKCQFKRSKKNAERKKNSPNNPAKVLLSWKYYPS